MAIAFGEGSAYYKHQLFSRLSMTSPVTEPAIEVFFSYAHADEPLRDKLATHLTLLERQGVIRPWHDRQIVAGTDWRGQVDHHIESAQVILLLISADFLASQYCYAIEMTRALERQQSGTATVIPILLRPVDNWSQSPFGGLKVLPSNGIPVTRWENEDEALVDVARGIRLAAEWWRRGVPRDGTRGLDRLPELLTYDLNRGAQEFQLSETIEHLDPSLVKPVLCILHGDQRECHEKFIRCLEKTGLRRLLRLQPTQAPCRYLITKWPSQPDELDHFHKRYCMHLGAEILEDNQATPQAINDRLASIPAPVIIETEFFTRRWQQHGAKVVQKVLEFWQNWPALAPNQILLVCLSIKYPLPQRSGCWAKIFAQRPMSEEVAATLETLSPAPKERVMLSVLPPLKGVTQQDAETWVRANETDLVGRYGEAAIDALHDTIQAMFEQCPSSEEPKRLPMEDVTRQLRSQFPAYRIQSEALS